MKRPVITVVGGSGFVGRHVVKSLCNKGYRVHVLCRDTVAASHLKTAGNVGQVAIEHADITKPESLKGKLNGSFAVVNLVSTLYSRGKQTFNALNVKGAEAVAREAKAAGVERFIQISALGADRATDTQYGRTKKAGEDAVHAQFPNATILRPSLVFGPGDGFFDRFARMALLAPALPLIAGGQTQYQPVYVEDVAKAIVAAIESEESEGKTFALAGPRRYTFRTMLKLLMETTGKKRMLAPLPSSLASLMGGVCEILPFPPVITRDQVRMLKHDTVQEGHENGLDALGITPRALEPLLPEILQRYAA